MAEPVVVAIVGPTAVGKSAVAVRLARQLIDGEIINADSRQVYRGFDIGAGIPGEDERGGVPHHLYGFSEPDDDFSLGRFLDAATCAIDDIHQTWKDADHRRWDGSVCVGARRGMERPGGCAQP